MISAEVSTLFVTNPTYVEIFRDTSISVKFSINHKKTFLKDVLCVVNSSGDKTFKNNKYLQKH